MRVAALQFDPQLGEVEENLAVVEPWLVRAAEEGHALVLLPEMWASSFCEATPALLEASAAAVARLCALSGELGLVLAGSAWGPLGPSGLPTNRLSVFEGGRALLEYDKLHLFSLTAEDKSFHPGELPPAAIDCGAGRLSGVTCYDLRFGPVCEQAWASGAELLLVPAQWPETRQSHWEALVRGRAVEGQLYVLGANRTGSVKVGRAERELDFPGNSLLADPHGQLLAAGTGQEGLVGGEVNLDEARRLRVHVPVVKDRRAELYGSWGTQPEA